jgi:peroxiredoxin
MSLGPIRPRAVFEAALWLVLIGFVGSRMWPQIAAAFGVASASEQAPDFHLTTLTGEPVSRESLHGKVVLLNFWATWCPPCRVEMPGFQKIYDQRRDRGFTILGVSTDAVGSARVASFLGERGITYPVAMATGEMVGAFGNVTTLPTSFLIDRQGRIRHQVRGIFASVALESAVDRLLAEPDTGGTR